MRNWYGPCNAHLAEFKLVNADSRLKGGDRVPSVSDTNEIMEPTVVSEPPAGEAEVLHASIKAGAVAQIVLAVIAVIGLLYVLKLVLVTIFVSLLLAYLLEPPVKWLTMLRIPRWAAALIVVLLAVACSIGAVYFSYNKAVDFADQFPKYSERMHNTLGRIRYRAIRIEDQARSMVESPPAGKSTVPVRVQQDDGLFGLLSRNSGTILDVSLAIGFVPFLVYFMLTMRDHTHWVTVRLFPKQHRLLAHRTVGTISAMIRSYIVANVLIGVLNSLICTLIFAFLGINYFYFIGALSGFISLVPYLGVFVSLLPPLVAGFESLDKTGITLIIVSLIGLHVLTMNALYPKFVGKRLRLNPLVVSMSLLFWGWIWGPPGLVLAIPVLGAVKIICDHLDPLRGLGSWLGESLKPGAA